MNPLQAAAVVVVGYNIAVRIPPRACSLVGLSKSVHALVSNVATPYQANALELGQGCKPGDGLVREVLATAQINVSDSVAAMDKPLDGIIRDVATVAEMDVVKILSKPRNGIDSRVGNVATLGQDKIAESGSHVNDLLHSTIRKASTAGEVKYTEMLVNSVRRKRQECRVVDQFAVGKTKFAEGLSSSEQGRDWLIANVSAGMKVDLENVWAVVGKSHDGVVVELVAVIEFELFERVRNKGPIGLH